MQDYGAPTGREQDDRLAGWLATLSSEQREQALLALRSLPRHDADDAWRHLVPQWVGVTDSKPR
jgi:hypothetical protein